MGTIVKLVWRGIRANLGRLVLTLVSVFLGVAFVSGSFVLADSLRSIFDQISEDAFAGVDAQVRMEETELSSDEVLARFDASVVDDIAALPEVEAAEGGLFVFEQVYLVDDDGEIIRPQGPPVFTSSWGGPSVLSSFTLTEGSAPVGDQVALDEVQAEAAEISVGDSVTIIGPNGEPQTMELSGIIDFGDGGTGGAYFLLFDLPTTQRLLDSGDVVDSIVINGGETPADELLSAVDAVLPGGLEVVSAEVVIGEQQDSFGSFINIFGNVLLGFAIVVLFVSTFIIYNTFAILVGQRTRQLGLLRSIGASAAQVRFMVLIEALIIGMVASLAGLFGGLGVAWLLKQLFSSAGGGFPDGPLELRTRTIVVVIIVGLVVTLLSALVPAFRAAQVAPLDAIRDGGRRERSLRFRIIAGALVLVPGLVLLGLGLFADIDGTANRLSAIGVGGALTFVGVAMMAALFAGPVVSVLGQRIPILIIAPIPILVTFIGGIALIISAGFNVLNGFIILVAPDRLPDDVDVSRWLGLVALLVVPLLAYLGWVLLRSGAEGIVGVFRLLFRRPERTLLRIARDNAQRNPQRTAATSTALMIGLALITGVAVLSASLLATFDELLEDSITADLFVFEEAQNLPFSSQVVDDLAALDEVDAVSGFQTINILVDGERQTATAYQSTTGSEVVNMGVTDGSITDLGEDGIALLADTAEAEGLSIGDRVSVEFEDGFTTDLEVRAFFDDDSVIGAAFVIDRSLSGPHQTVDQVGFVGLLFAEGVDVEAGRVAVEDVTARFPQLTVQDNTEFKEEVQAQISQIQIVINGLLVLCLIVAVFGIVNTMVLSVLERIREIGLLRAVGTTRPQLRSSIRWEAVIVSVFGSTLGVLMGLLLGWAAVSAIPDSFISAVAIPWLQLVAYVLVGAAIGVVAAYFPASRAAKLDVLAAISHE